jgi:hypothetical protein
MMRVETSSMEAQVKTSNGVKRYTLVLPETLFQQVEQLADDRGTTVVDLLRRFIKLGLLAVQIEESPGKALLIREGTELRELLMLA